MLSTGQIMRDEFRIFFVSASPCGSLHSVTCYENGPTVYIHTNSLHSYQHVHVCFMNSFYGSYSYSPSTLSNVFGAIHWPTSISCWCTIKPTKIKFCFRWNGNSDSRRDHGHVWGSQARWAATLERAVRANYTDVQAGVSCGTITRWRYSDQQGEHWEKRRT